GEGEILWDKTVNECFAYFSNDRPIYLDYFNRRSIVDDENFLKRLHEVVLTTISNELEDNGMLELLDLTSVNFTDDVLSDLGDLDYLLYRIESELNREFNTRKQSLLKALYVYVSQNYDFDKDKYASIFGTNSFHVIWEKVCSMVLNDKLEVTIGELKLTPTGENSTSTLLKDMIDKPIWSNKDRRISASKTLVPDTITVFKNKLLILDGKYYNLRFDPLSGNPGVGDVTKQFLYALAYKEFAEKNNLVIENYFLMPTEMETDLGFAYVEMNLLDNLGLSPVKVAKLTASKMYQKYLDHEVDKDLLSKF
ncbi:TPA: LlaJI family restriction endonuclease, partial [Streptococcus suis]|nr:LlaJI family restriction endonuclease [Streptococcus suis]